MKLSSLLFLLCLLVVNVASQTNLTDEDKETILNEHNRLRGIVSPTASNMQRMVSDPYSINLYKMLKSETIKLLSFQILLLEFKACRSNYNSCS